MQPHTEYIKDDSTSIPTLQAFPAPMTPISLDHGVPLSSAPQQDPQLHQLLPPAHQLTTAAAGPSAHNFGLLSPEQFLAMPVGGSSVAPTAFLPLSASQSLLGGHPPLPSAIPTLVPSFPPIGNPNPVISGGDGTASAPSSAPSGVFPPSSHFFFSTPSSIRTMPQSLDSSGASRASAGRMDSPPQQSIDPGGFPQTTVGNSGAQQAAQHAFPLGSSPWPAATVPPPPAPPPIVANPTEHLINTAANADLVVAQKTLEQHVAAAQCQAAHTAAEASADPEVKAGVTAQAMHAQARYEAASSDAAAAQSVADHCRQAAATLAVQQQQAAVAAAAAAISFVPGTAHPHGVDVGSPPGSATSLLAHAAADAKQTAVQKRMETQAAAAAWQNAAAQVAAAVDPSHHAAASAIAQHAALLYQTAARGSAAASATAAHFDQAAAAASAAALSPLGPGHAMPPAPSILYGAPPPPPHPTAAANLAGRGVSLPLSAPSLGGGHPLPVSSPPQVRRPRWNSPIDTAEAPASLTPPASTAAHLQQQQHHQQVPGFMPEMMATLSALANPASAPGSPSSFSRAPSVIKAVCTSGGAFMRRLGGSWDYEGGENRLVSLSFGCCAEALFSTLERVTASHSSDSVDTPSDFTPILRYRLPSDPTVWVDLVDDEDVGMMFEEWQDACASSAVHSPRSSIDHQGGGSSTSSGQPRLHIFVQWTPTPQQSNNSEYCSAEVGSTPFSRPGSSEAVAAPPPREQSAATPEIIVEIPPASGFLTPFSNNDNESAPREQQQQRPPAALPAAATATDEDRQLPQGSLRSATSSPKPPSRRPRRRRGLGRGAASLGSAPSESVELSDLVERMEVIAPSDVSLSKFLGSGAYGDVYLGRWHGCEVAVKCLSPSLFFQGASGTINRTAIVDLIREADLLGSLRHPCVVWVYGVVLSEEGSEGDDLVDAIQREAGAKSMMPGMLRPPALVMEFMAGGSLKAALARRADIVAGSLTRVVLALDAAKGMEYLHSKKIVHFDLKSGNLLLGYRDRRPVCKVVDFGLAREKAQTFVSGVTSQRGTLPWTAPEILRTPEAVTEKVDVFSFGIVMWELLTGREPFEGLNYHALMIQLANPEAQLRPPIPGTPEWDGSSAAAPPELAPGWIALMQRCWDDSPAARPPFSEIVKELRGMIAAAKAARGGGGGQRKERETRN